MKDEQLEIFPDSRKTAEALEVSLFALVFAWGMGLFDRFKRKKKNASD